MFSDRFRKKYVMYYIFSNTAIVFNPENEFQFSVTLVPDGYIIVTAA